MTPTPDLQNPPQIPCKGGGARELTAGLEDPGQRQIAQGSAGTGQA